MISFSYNYNDIPYMLASSSLVSSVVSRALATAPDLTPRLFDLLFTPTPHLSRQVSMLREDMFRGEPYLAMHFRAGGELTVVLD